MTTNPPNELDEIKLILRALAEKQTVLQAQQDRTQQQIDQLTRVVETSIPDPTDNEFQSDMGEWQSESGKYNFPKSGIRKFADLLREQMEAAFPKITVKELVNRLAAIGYDTNPSRIDRLRSGLATEPPAGLIWAIAKLELLRHPSDRPYSHEELLELMTEQLEENP
jgi:hypothetical protein